RPQLLARSNGGPNLDLQLTRSDQPCRPPAQHQYEGESEEQLGQAGTSAYVKGADRETVLDVSHELEPDAHHCRADDSASDAAVTTEDHHRDRADALRKEERVGGERGDVERPQRPSYPRDERRQRERPESSTPHTDARC